MRAALILVAAVTLILRTTAIADADTRKVGDVLTYDIVTVTKHRPSPNIPKAQQAQYEAIMEKPQTFNFSVSIDRVDADGSAHAAISSHTDMPKMPFGMHGPNLDASFEGSVLVDGQIVPTFDATLATATIAKFQSSTRGHIYQPTPEEQSNLGAYFLSDRLYIFNDVALGAGKRKAFKDGDAWRIIVADKNDELVTFSDTGTQSYRGHAVVALAVTSLLNTPSGPRTTKGTAYYDPQQDTVIGLHVDVEAEDMGADVIGQTIDINLRQ